MGEILAHSVAVRALAWGIAQSIWQGALAGGLTALLLLALRGARPSLRYAAASAGLFAAAALPVVSASSYARDLRAATALRPATMTLSAPVADRPGAIAVAAPARDESPVTVSRGLDWPAAWRERADTWSAIAVPIWCLGVLLGSIRLAHAWLAGASLARRAAHPASDATRAVVIRLAQALGITRPVRIAEWDGLAGTAGPMVIGWFRPVLLLPAAALTGLSPIQLEAIVAHELAHVRRHDYLVNLLQSAVDVLFFYHPAVWWLSRQIRLEREHCCDDVAVEACGDRLAYARALARLEERRGHAFQLSVAATGGELARRIRRVLGAAPPVTPSIAGVLLGVALVACSLTLAGAFGSTAQSAAPVPGPAAKRAGAGSTGTIRGRVTTAGQPAGNVLVDVLQAGPREGELQPPASVTTVLTGADGYYEARDLEPGDYTIAVQAPGYIAAEYGQRHWAEQGRRVQVRAGQVADGLDVALGRGGAIGGRILNDRGEGLSGVEIQVLGERFLPGGKAMVPAGLAQTGEGGQYRVGDLPPGRYLVKAYMAGAPRPSGDPPRRYAPTCFPGASCVQDAEAVLVAEGRDSLDVDFPLLTSAPRTVSGRLVDPAGDFLGLSVRLMPFAGNGSEADSRSAAVSADGRFVVDDVAPGEYFVVVHGARNQSEWLRRWGSLLMHRIAVTNDVHGLEIAARQGSRVDGRVVADQMDGLPFDPGMLTLESMARLPDSVGADGQPVQAGIVHGRVRPDRSFAYESLVGPAVLQVSGLPPGWAVKSIRRDGADVTDRPVDFSDGAAPQVEIVLTNRLTGIAGRVRRANSRQAASDYTVVVFPSRQEQWTFGARLIRAVRAGQDGGYQIEGLPAGDYLAIAVDALPRFAWTDAAVLERLAVHATPVRLREGERRSLELRMSSVPDAARLPL